MRWPTRSFELLFGRVDLLIISILKVYRIRFREAKPQQKCFVCGRELHSLKSLQECSSVELMKILFKALTDYSRVRSIAVRCTLQRIRSGREHLHVTQECAHTPRDRVISQSSLEECSKREYLQVRRYELE